MKCSMIFYVPVDRLDSIKLLFLGNRYDNILNLSTGGTVAHDGRCIIKLKLQGIVEVDPSGVETSSKKR